MKFLLPLLACFNCHALEFGWTPPSSGADGYLMTHWSSNASVVDQYGNGSKTNMLYQGVLVDGANYFAVSSYKTIGGQLLISTFSNVAIVTNTPALLLKSITFGSSNLAGSWIPFQTNQTLIHPNLPVLFLKTTNSLTPTNLITVPKP